MLGVHSTTRKYDHLNRCTWDRGRLRALLGSWFAREVQVIVARNYQAVLVEEICGELECFRQEDCEHRQSGALRHLELYVALFVDVI